MKKISLVLPTFNEEESIEQFYTQVCNTITKINPNYTFELCFVNDGSFDKTEEILKSIQLNDSRIRVISFTKNFGHQSAISAGIEHSDADVIITMDTDLQDPPEVIVEMIEHYEDGYDVVHGVRSDRKDSFFKKFSAFLFYKLFRLMSGYGAIENTADFKLIDKSVQQLLNQNPSSKSFLRGSIAKYGKNQSRVYYVRPERFAGKSKYSLKKMSQLAIDGIKFAISSKLLKPPYYEIREIV